MKYANESYWQVRKWKLLLSMQMKAIGKYANKSHEQVYQFKAITKRV